MKKLVIASHNAGKVREINALLSPFGIDVVSAAELNLPEPEETGASFAENASIKSEAAAKASHLHALSDDSGLCVPAMGDAPGIYSARWAGKTKDFSIAMQRIHDELKQKQLEPTGQAAYFICVLALTSPEGKTQIFEGRVDGTLTFPPRGNKGFGYDPIFIPEGREITFAEMEAEAKHAISHRARAFAQLIEHLKR
ncbi:MAG TPA: RdgB/HAM1 family non-canonical purine NTP pyrophosphatase [Rickettsiales bacterium]|nr:RdgB/HAM1 family non-canonical purine NTP pyrophosphatase [Rickettsiales bacterium]